MLIDLINAFPHVLDWISSELSKRENGRDSGYPMMDPEIGFNLRRPDDDDDIAKEIFSA